VFQLIESPRLLLHFFLRGVSIRRPTFDLLKNLRVDGVPVFSYLLCQEFDLLGQ
jgi:hypothetical protein